MVHADVHGGVEIVSEDGGGGASRTTDPAAGSSAATDVSLREYLAVRIADGQRQTTERFGFVLAIGAIIWFFIERHLAQLNNSHERLDHAVAQNVSSDTYEANEQQRDKEAAELGEWRKSIDKAGTQSVSRDEFQRDTKSDRRGSLDTGTKIVAAIVGVIALLISAVVLALAVVNYQALHHTTDTPPATTVTVPAATGP